MRRRCSRSPEEGERRRRMSRLPEEDEKRRGSCGHQRRTREGADSPLQENMDSSAETTRPPGFENIEPCLEEENTGSSVETTRPPGFENIGSLPTFFPENLEKSVDSSLETSLPPTEENPSPLHNLLAGNHNLPGSLCTEKSVGSSPDMSRPPGWENDGSQPIPAPPLPVLINAEVGQMVCGSCRQLLSYPRGAMHVKCPCCEIINFVLEEHQVGNVKCGKCSVLLMYPYGAPCVRCSSCRFVTEIGTHNVRPPFSVQQGRFSVPQNPVHLRVSAASISTLKSSCIMKD